jgi:hypothetical protein
MQQRRARIRPALARQYPGVEPTHWYPAAILAHYVQRRDGSGKRGSADRTMSEQAFEFAGGAARAGAWVPSRRGEPGHAQRERPLPVEAHA